MKAGQLRQKIVVERLQQGQDAYGEPLTDWVPLFDSWAAVEPLSGRIYFAAQAAQSEITAKITMRYRPGVAPADRVRHGDTLYNIESVIDYRSAGRELQLMCRALA